MSIILRLRGVQCVTRVQSAFGATVKRIRAQRRLSLSELGQTLGVSRQTVWDWERGRSHPPMSDVPRIADTLEITICELYGRKEMHAVGIQQQRERDIVAHRLGQLIQQMTPVDQTLVDALVGAITSWTVAERARLRAEEGLPVGPLPTTTPVLNHSARAS
jgi:transcriptional regulator with XRE-family HTH domain